MSTQERNKATVARVFAACWNQGDMAAIDEIFAPNFKHDQFLPDWPKGTEGFKLLVKFWRKAFPDLLEEVVELLADGDKVATRFRLRGTHKGEFYGIPPTGRRIDIYGADIYTFKDGKVVEYLYHEDTLGVFFQLGMLPLSLNEIAGVKSLAA